MFYFLPTNKASQWDKPHMDSQVEEWRAHTIRALNWNVGT